MKKSQHFIYISICVLIISIIVVVLFKDGIDSDYLKLSGSGHGAVSIFIDPETGVQYLSCFGHMTPRLNSDGNIIVNHKPTMKTNKKTIPLKAF